MISTDESAAGPVCPVCGAATEQAPFTHHNGCDLYRCAGCRAVYVHPYPSDDLVDEMYASTLDRARSEVGSKMDKKMRRSRGRAKRLRRLAAGDRFLDVGSNVGFMVEAAREAGFDATGIEIDENYVNVARETFPANTFHCGLVQEHRPDHDGYHMVYCSEVIEHVPDIQGFAAALAGLLAPGGKLFVTTPDIGHWRVPKRIADWDAFCPPSHCVYFNPDNLAGLFERHGLRTEKRFVAFKPGIKMLFARPA